MQFYILIFLIFTINLCTPVLHVILQQMCTVYYMFTYLTIHLYSILNVLIFYNECVVCTACLHTLQWMFVLCVFRYCSLMFVLCTVYLILYNESVLCTTCLQLVQQMCAVYYMFAYFTMNVFSCTACLHILQLMFVLLYCMFTYINMNV